MTLLEPPVGAAAIDPVGLEVLEATVRRLAAEFPDRCVLTEVTAAVAGAQRDLDGHGHAEALPELVERLARSRLLRQA